jgi:hypothetical protein
VGGEASRVIEPVKLTMSVEEVREWHRRQDPHLMAVRIARRDGPGAYTSSGLAKRVAFEGTAISYDSARLAVKNLRDARVLRREKFPDRKGRKTRLVLAEPELSDDTLSTRARNTRVHRDTTIEGQQSYVPKAGPQPRGRLLGAFDV